MSKVYKNIVNNTPVKLISGDDIRTTSNTDIIELSSLTLANTYSASITVSVYLEAINIKETEHLYGILENNYSSLLDDYATSSSKKYYLIKDLVLPLGTAIDLIDAKGYSYSAEYSLKIEQDSSLYTADVVVDYERIKIEGTKSPTRTIKQY